MNFRKLSSCLIVTLSALSIWFMSCGKHNDSGTKLYRVKTEIDTIVISGIDTIINRHTYIYDAQGRLSQAQISYYRDFYSYVPPVTTGTTLITYTYSGDRVTRSVQGNNFSPAVYRLNNKGLMEYSIDTDPAASPDDSITYQYDAKGHLVKKTFWAGGAVSQTFKFTVANGNWDYEIVTSPRGGNQDSFASKESYSYSTSLDLRDFGTPYFGTRNTNVNILYSDSSLGSLPAPPFVVDHQFDSLGRVIYEKLDYTTSSVYTYY